MLNEEFAVKKCKKKINHVKNRRNNVHYIKVLRLQVSIFRFNVNSEFTFNDYEQ